MKFKLKNPFKRKPKSNKLGWSLLVVDIVGFGALIWLTLFPLVAPVTSTRVNFKYNQTSVADWDILSVVYSDKPKELNLLEALISGFGNDTLDKFLSYSNLVLPDIRETFNFTSDEDVYLLGVFGVCSTGLMWSPWNTSATSWPKMAIGNNYVILGDLSITGSSFKYSINGAEFTGEMKWATP